MKVGFIGVGDQGAPMATRVLGAGHELLAYARRPEVRAHFAELGAEVVGRQPSWVRVSWSRSVWWTTTRWTRCS